MRTDRLDGVGRLKKALILGFLPFLLWGRIAADEANPAIPEEATLDADAATVTNGGSGRSMVDELAILSARAEGLEEELGESGLPDEEKKILETQLSDGVSSLTLARDFDGRLQSEWTLIESGEERIRSRAAELAAFRGEIQAIQDSIERVDLTGLQGILRQLEKEREQLVQRVREAEARESKVFEIPTVSDERQREISRQLQSLDLGMEEQAHEDLELGERVLAFSKTTRALALEAELSFYRFQWEYYEQLERESRANLSLERKKLESLERLIAEVNGLVQEQRKLEAEIRLQESLRAEAESRALGAGWASFAAETAILTDEIARIIGAEMKASARLAEVEKEVEELNGEYEALSGRMELGSNTVAGGRLLLVRRAALIERSKDRRRAPFASNAIGEVTERQTQLSYGLDSMVKPPAEPKSEVEIELVAARVKALEDLRVLYNRYGPLLVRLRSAERSLGESEERLRNTVEVWLIGARTAPRLDWRSSLTLPVKTGELLSDLSVKRWHSVTQAYRQQRPFFLLLVMLGIGSLVFWSKLRRELESLSQKTRRIREDRMSHTFKALVIHLIRVTPLPLLLYSVGVLNDGAWGVDLAEGDGATFRLAALNFFGLLFLYDIGNRYGLGVGHFRWSEAWGRHYRACLRWFSVLVPVLLFFTYGSSIPVSWNDAPENRGLLLMRAVVIVAFGWMMVRRGSDWAKGPGAASILIRWGKFWRLLLIATFLVVCWLLSQGYVFTTGLLLRQLVMSGMVVAGIFVIEGIVLRYLTLSERRLRFQRSLEKLEQARQKNADLANKKSSEGGEMGALVIEEPEVNFKQLGERAKRLVSALVFVSVVASLWMLWANLIPIFDLLGRVDLPLKKMVLVEGVETRAALTLADILVAGIVVGITVILTANLPSLLEITILSSPSLDRGIRYAVMTLTRYVIVGVGIVLALQEIGFRWQSVQWLVAALGVGLGFGLQEIVANFVSGIILLFERPIRVGDIVTIGDTTGVVTKIKIRAVTVLNWDKQEMLIPNKELITGRLLNWTLSDSVNRIMVPVGVAYGTDTRRALEIMREVAQQDSNVLDDPSPLLSFEAFGDSSLNLMLRCYLRNLDNRIATITNLHHTIHERFAEEGIEIAFPQLDIHHRGLPPEGAGANASIGGER